MGTFNQLIQHKYFPWLVVLLLAIPSFFSLLKAGFFPMQDDLQAFRILEMDKCFKDNQIPCQWVPDAGYQYGYPQFIFYPPSVYYLGEFIHLLGFQIIDSVKILFILGFISGALTMFLLLRSLLNNWSAVIGALLYTYIPYKAVDVYVRGAMSEFWALSIFPLAFWSSYLLIKTNRKKYLFWFAVSIGLLLTTHSLMSMVFLPFLGVWGLFWIWQEKRWNSIRSLVLGGLLGAGTAAFFVLPMVFERQFVHVESMLGGYFDYRQHFVDLKQLFLSNHFGYGSSYLGPNDDLSLSAGLLHWPLSILAVLLAAVNYKQNKKLSYLVFTLTGISLINLFLLHQKSSFIWERINILSWLQFPWRLLANNSFFLSVISGITVFYLSKMKYPFSKQVLIAFSAVVLALTFYLYGSFFQPKSWLDINDSDKFSGVSWEKQLTISIFDYLPIYAKLPPNHVAPALPEVLDGQVEFISYDKGSNYQKGEVFASKPSLIRLPLFDFPGMEVRLNNQVVSHRHNECRGEEYCFGLITIDIPEGKHQLAVNLKHTPVRFWGNVITLGSLLTLLSIYLLLRKKR